MSPEQTQKTEKRAIPDLIRYLRSESCFFEVAGSLDSLVMPDHREPLTQIEVCVWTLARCMEDLQHQLLNDPSGVIARALRVLEHERIMLILEKAVDEQPWQADPHFIRFTIAIVASCLEACSRDKNRLPYHLKPSGS